MAAALWLSAAWPLHAEEIIATESDAASSLEQPQEDALDQESESPPLVMPSEQPEVNVPTAESVGDDDAGLPQHGRPSAPSDIPPSRPEQVDEPLASEPSASETAPVWRFSGGLAAGGGHFAAHLSLARDFTRYTGSELTVAYSRYSLGAWSGESYGPDLDFVLRGTNPTLVTPFAGLGLGYEKWRRARHGHSFDDRGSATFSGFWGVDLALTKHFGLRIGRRQTLFLAAAPKVHDDPNTDEPKLRMVDSIGFRFVL